MTLQPNDMEKKRSNAVLDEIIKSLTNDFIKPEGEMKFVSMKLKELLDYYLHYEKTYYGPVLIKLYKSFCKDEIDEKDIFLAEVLAWCLDIIIISIMVADDIMDQSYTRRGKLCWYKKEGVGLSAINDAFSLEACVYFLLRKYFHHKPYYVNLVEFFHKIMHRTIAGQSLDLMTETGEKLELEKFTIDRFNTIAKYKTALNPFCFPTLALYMAEISDPKIHDTLNKMFIEMGILFQVQNDYDDCFGDTSITGKIGTDIEDGKCTWFIVNALKLGNPNDVAIIRENFGRNKPECIAKVKGVYEKLQLPALVKNYTDEKYKLMMKLVDQLQSDIATNIILELINIICKKKLFY